MPKKFLSLWAKIPFRLSVIPIERDKTQLFNKMLNEEQINCFLQSAV